MNAITLVAPFYRNPLMLKRQVQEWNEYPEGVNVICVDDGSPEPALPIILSNSRRCAIHRDGKVCNEAQLYRIQNDIPWNRGGARNLGAHLAETDWIIHVDIDHVLPADAADKLLDYKLDKKSWYRFPRWRVGKADETRKKDQIPNDCEYGQVHPHVDSYLIRKELYWSDKVGGYDEDYSGALGGGNMFLKRLQDAAPCEILPPPIRLEVYTRDAIKDANDWSLPRDTTRNKELRRQKELRGDTRPKNPLRFEWVREL